MPVARRPILAAVALAAALTAASPAVAEEWKRTVRLPAQIKTPAQFCDWARGSVYLSAAEHGVRVRKFRCDVYRRFGRWRPIDVYVRLSGTATDGFGNRYRSRFVQHMVDFDRRVVRLFGADGV